VLAAVAVGGAFSSGFYYMKDGWRQVRIEKSRGRCSTTDNICVCDKIERLDMPSQGVWNIIFHTFLYLLENNRKG